MAAADLLVASLERLFAPWLARTEPPCLLLNVEERVIVSNALTHNVADVVRATGELHIFDIVIFGWSLAIQPARPLGNRP